MVVGKTGFESHPCSVRTVAELHSASRVYLAAGSHCDPLQEPLNLNTVASDCHCLECETKSTLISARIYRNYYLGRQAHLINSMGCRMVDVLSGGHLLDSYACSPAYCRCDFDYHTFVIR